MEEREQCGSCSPQHGCGGGHTGHGGHGEFYMERMRAAERMKNVKNKLVVLSGKGGVGKSTVAANLAVSLSMAGNKVGLLDIDIHGPSIPKMLGLKNVRPKDDGKQLFPVNFSENLKVMSIDFFLPSRDEAIIWRGAMKFSAISQFLSDVDWGELDFLIIDCPPGTGDEPLTIAQLLDKPVGAIVVTTPQDVAMVNVRKSITFCKHLKLPVVGIVENMSGFVCEKCGEVTEIFKSGGAEKLSKEFGVPFLGKIPLDPLVAISGDEGKPCVLSYEGSETAKAYKKITEKVVEMTKELSEPVGAKDIKKLTIAMPVSNGSLCSHFGHCEEFVLFDVDTDKKTILRERRLTPPPHEPGVLPNWLEEQGAHLIIAAGMGVKAQNLFAEKGIVVITGVEQKQIEEIVKDYLEDKLVTGENICDH